MEINNEANYDTPAIFRKNPSYRPTYDARGVIPDDLTHIERAVANDTISAYDTPRKRNPLAVLLGAVIAVAALVALISAAASAAAR